MKKLYNDKLKRSVKVGDTVIIKPLEEVERINKQYKFPFCFAEEMYRFCGKKAKVVEMVKDIAIAIPTIIIIGKNQNQVGLPWILLSWI